MNMALDQAMLDQASISQQCLLRFYQWEQPTLSLGYFQPYAERHEHQASSSIECVRRSTGGGAIIHHHDWTYSLALPESSTNGKKLAKGATEELYDCIHAEVVSWLNERFHVNAKTWPANAQATSVGKAEPFLCFARRSTGDVVVDTHKLLGSAQRRQKGAILQHGSFLLAKSPFAPTLLGLQEVVGNSLLDPPTNDLADIFEEYRLRIRRILATRMGLKFTEAKNLVDFIYVPDTPGKYAESAWTEKR